jgi:hypothetical protein
MPRSPPFSIGSPSSTKPKSWTFGPSLWRIIGYGLGEAWSGGYEAGCVGSGGPNVERNEETLSPWRRVSTWMSGPPSSRRSLRCTWNSRSWQRTWRRRSRWTTTPKALKQAADGREWAVVGVSRCCREAWRVCECGNVGMNMRIDPELLDCPICFWIRGSISKTRCNARALC